MDRPIATATRRNRHLRRAAVAVLVVALLIVAGVLLGDWFAPSVRRSAIRTAIVEVGPIEATLTASGTVVPEYEHVLTSPIESRVTRILQTPGDLVEPGQPILDLDTGSARLDLEKLADQIALKTHDRTRARLDQDATLADLQGQREIKVLELQSLEFEADRGRQYAEMGLFSKDEARKAEIDAERAHIELRQLDEAMLNAGRTLEANLQGLELEISILQKEEAEAARRLQQATAAADRAGVVTWVVPSEGMAVQRGDEIARIADLSAFRVEATISDIHAPRIIAGMPATIRTGEHKLTGRVSGVRPTVENGIVTLDVTLADMSHAVLRHNLRVEVYLVTERKERALQVDRGPFLTRDGEHAVFVIRGNVARRTPVELGMANFEKYEILEGLSVGDEVIVSDMSEHFHRQEVKLR